MKKHKLGKSNLEVSALCFGGNVFGWTVDEPLSFKLLDQCLAVGLNFIDTADVYSNWIPGHQGGESETIIGKWLKRSGNRDKVIIATKVGIEMSPGHKGLSEKHILCSVDDSLRRLQTDYIDLYQSHKDDPETPLEETLAAYAELIKQGKVRVIGASNYSAERLAESLKVSEKLGCPRYESLQPLYNLYDREEYETTLDPLCVKEKIGVISYYSLAAGFLTGKYRTKEDLASQARGFRVERYMTDRGLKILNALDKVAKEYGATQATVAIAWLMAQSSVTSPIASATGLEQLNYLIAATTLKLDPPAIEYLNNSSSYAVKV